MARRKAIIGLVRAAALSGALFLAGAAVPIVGSFALLFAPAPVLIYAAGRPRASLRAAAAVALATALVTLAARPAAGLSYGLTFGLAAIVMCWMLERRCPLESIVAATAAGMLAAGIIAALALAGSPDALLGMLRESLQAGMARGSGFYKQLGLPADAPAGLQADILEIVIRLMPALAAIAAAAMAFLNLRIFWRWAGQQRLPYSLFGELDKWSAPDWLVWVLLAAGFAYQGFKYLIPVKPVETIALDALLCVAAAYFCQGLAIMSFYFRVLAMPVVARTLIYLVACVQPVLAALVCVAGVLDMWIDFRRLKPPSQEAGNFGDFL